MGMEDYQVNGMGYEKLASEHRLDYLNANNFGHVRFAITTSCVLCGRQACNLLMIEACTPESRVIRTIHPSVCRYSEV